MSETFAGKVALVTGAATGLGRATALLFAERGAKLVLGDVNVEDGEAVAALIRESGGDAVFARTDVSDPSDCDALVDAAVQTFGGLHCAFNNAARRSLGGTTEELDLDEWQKGLATNLVGVAMCMRAELRYMSQAGQGAIVNTSSGAGLRGLANRSIYAAAKHGVIGLTKTAALEYAHRNIRINAICPGPMVTPMLEKHFADSPGRKEELMSTVPMGRIADPAEVGKAALWLCSDESSYVTGVALPVDGGLVVGY